MINKMKYLGAAGLMVLSGAAFAQEGGLPPEVSTEIDAVVSNLTALSGIVMTAVITVTGAFVLIKWVRRGINRV